MQWIDVDMKGLAQLIEQRGKSFVLNELIQNAWDEDGTTKVNVILEPVPNVAKAWLTVEDDNPEGFHDLRHAYTLFAASKKKADAKKRGRFNFGCKLVLALCDEATIITTKGGVSFTDKGRHSLGRNRREAGSVFRGLLRITRDELAEALDSMRRLLPPKAIVSEGVVPLLPPKTVATTINGEIIASREPLATFEAYLQTVIATDDGHLKTAHRHAFVHVHEPRPGEVPSLYEMGIPVMPTGDRYHLDVQQKVPLGFDRDNVPPAYLRELRARTLNNVHAKLTKDEFAAQWVTEATTGNVEPKAVSAVLDARFGEKRVIFDASDVEANKRAIAAGYNVIHGGSLPAETWKVVKESGLALPAGQVTPSPRQNWDPNGRDYTVIEPDKWTPGMKRVVAFYIKAAEVLIDKRLLITMACDFGLTFNAEYSHDATRVAEIILNKARLGNEFFEAGLSEEVIRLLIHELAHDKVADHLSDDYHRECCRLGARLAIKTARGEIDELWRDYLDELGGRRS